MSYDLSIALRISPFLNSRHIYFASKYELVETCFKSFITALSGIDYELFTILDGCPDCFEKMLRKNVEESRLKVIRTNKIGNNATFMLQIQILSNKASSDYVYFAEDDYFYVEHFKHLLEFIRKNRFIDFVSPYDHPDYYLRKDLHPYRIIKLAYNNRIWKNVMSTTCTFLTKKEILRETCEILKSYARIGDYFMWYVLTRKISLIDFLKIVIAFHRRNIKTIAFHQQHLLKEAFLLKYLIKTPGTKYHLWVPEPTIATHMQKDCLSPGINWNHLLSRKCNAKSMKQ
ncbi:MAG: hypothetical protein QXO75_05895 [Nitrososphaerota archaeon]